MQFINSHLATNLLHKSHLVLIIFLLLMLKDHILKDHIFNLHLIFHNTDLRDLWRNILYQEQYLNTIHKDLLFLNTALKDLWFLCTTHKDLYILNILVLLLNMLLKRLLNYHPMQTLQLFHLQILATQLLLHNMLLSNILHKATIQQVPSLIWNYSCKLFVCVILAHYWCALFV